MTDAPAIDVQQVRKDYKDGWLVRKRFSALNGVDLTVRRGEVFGLLGPNGAGKTTLIKILLGIVRSSSGKAFLLGDRAGSKLARRKIGYLPENLNFPAHHTARRSLAFYGRLSGVPETTIKQRGDELLEMVGLLGRDRELVRKYSKGMRQRLGLAQAMLHEPELLILDEPTDGLDPVGRSEIRRIISTLKDQGKTVFLNSHILQEVELVCDRVAILAGGALRGVGTPSELTSQFHGALTAKLRIELSGGADAVEQLRSRVSCELLPLPDSRWQFSSAAESQADVDRLIDTIRSLQLSIHRLERTRLTLEEVFLSAVQSSDPISSAN
ncbi:MAG: ABC transporter ATP-binding protein [Planctomycetales bacterium]|nr:ABC transporter ATP-binding protein [Planctomycetales bacterium]